MTSKSWAVSSIVDRVILLAGEGGHTASDVAGQGLDLLERDGIDLAVAGFSGERLEVELSVAGDHREADAVPVAPGDEGLEHLLGRHPQLERDRLGGQVVEVDFVFPKFVSDAQPVERPRGVGFRDGQWTSLLMEIVLQSIGPGMADGR